MIYLKRFGLIFVKTVKTAGTSVEIGLSALARGEDILTPMDDEAEKLRRDSASIHGGASGPQNDLYDWREIMALGPGPIVFALMQRRRHVKFHRHMSAKEARSALTEEAWSHSLSFAVERNPFDRMTSLYFWETRLQEQPADFAEWFRKSGHRVASQRNMYMDGDDRVVRDVVRYDHLDQEFLRILREVGAPVVELGYAKTGIRPRGRHWRDVIGEPEREVIAYLCRDEIEEFGFQW